jgi:hypothetical protein
VRTTIFVFKVLFTSVQIFGVNHAQTEAQQIENGSAALCAATPRPHALNVRAPPDTPPPEVARRPRPRAFPRPTPRSRHLGPFPAPRASPPLRRTSDGHAADRRSVRGAACMRAGRGAPWYGSIFAITVMSQSSALFKHRRSLPRATPSRRLPLPPSRQARLPASIIGLINFLPSKHACVFSGLV